MRQRLQGLIAGILIGTTIMGGVVYAARTKNIEAVYNNIKVYKDNVLCELKDANGTKVEPFIYEGTTYMPVRGTANIAGMDVTWDGSTNSVYLWDKVVPEDTFLVEVCPPYETDSSCKVFASKDAKSFLMAGEKYTNGLTLASYNTGKAYALFNLNGKYKEIEMIIAPMDGVKDPSGIAFIVDGKNVAEYSVHAGDYPRKITVPLNYGLQLKIATIYHDGYKETGLGNIVVK